MSVRLPERNAIDVQEVPFRASSEGYLAVFGRMAPEREAAEAIALAHDADLPLLAANCLAAPARGRPHPAAVGSLARDRVRSSVPPPMADHTLVLLLRPGQRVNLRAAEAGG